MSNQVGDNSKFLWPSQKSWTLQQSALKLKRVPKTKNFRLGFSFYSSRSNWTYLFVYYLFRQKAKKLWILFWQWLADWRMRIISQLSKKSCPWPTGTSPSWPSTWLTSCRPWNQIRPPQPPWLEPTSKNSEMISTTKCPRKGLPQIQVIKSNTKKWLE